MKNLTLIYFSPTGNTERYLEGMVQNIEAPRQTINITSADPEPRTFTEDDFVIFGAPVHGGRIPTQASKRLNAFKGNHTPCLLVASYGNRHYDDALMELNQIALENGFVPQAAAALVGRHTFGEVQVGRPDQNDIRGAAEFLGKVLSNIDINKKLNVPGNFPYKSQVAKGRFRPRTIEETCIKCGICVRGCPMGAIDEDFVTISDDCISCFRCIRYCPTHSKVCDTPEYMAAHTSFTERLKHRRENEYFL